MSHYGYDTLPDRQAIEERGLSYLFNFVPQPELRLTSRIDHDLSVSSNFSVAYTVDFRV